MGITQCLLKNLYFAAPHSRLCQFDKFPKRPFTLAQWACHFIRRTCPLENSRFQRSYGEKNTEAMDNGVLVPNFLLSKASIFQIANPQGYRKVDVRRFFFQKVLAFNRNSPWFLSNWDPKWLKVLKAPEMKWWLAHRFGSAERIEFTLMKKSNPFKRWVSSEERCTLGINLYRRPTDLNTSFP